MSYLGPKSFNTIPLTSSNLAYLNKNHSDMNSTTSNENSNNINNVNTLVTIQINNNNTIGEANINDHDDDKNITFNQSEDFKSLTSNHNKHQLETTPTIDSSSNSFSSLIDQSLKSSETSMVSIQESHSHRTLIDMNDDDNKTFILPPHNNDSQLLIPESPLRKYDVVSVSTDSLPLSPYQSNSKNDSKVKSDDDNNSALPIPLLRKKSGELIKSSLRLNTLPRSNSMPNAKSVRFANRLENVKFFKKSEKPNAVSSDSVHRMKVKTQWDFDSSSSSSPTSSDNDYDYSYNRFRYTDDSYEYDYDYDYDYNYNNDDDIDYDDEENTNNMNIINQYYNHTLELSDDYDNFLNDDKSQSSKWLIKSNDCPYNPLSLNFAKLSSNNNIILESVKLNSSGNSLIGFVYAKNITFEKIINVKVTYDHWNSFVEIHNANYISSNHIFKYSDSNSTNYDKFSFIIKLDELNVLHQNNLNLEFCISYTADNNCYWDNNNGKNYKISLVKKSLLNQTKTSSKTSNSSNSSNSSSRSSSRSNKTLPLFELEDSNIKLKDNNNFKLDNLYSKPSTDINSLRYSNSFGLKKIKSESSLPSMKPNFNLSNKKCYHENKSVSSLSSKPTKIDDFKSSSTIPSLFSTNRIPVSKSLSASPALKSSSAFDSHHLSDYDHIIKQFCFFTTSDSTENNNCYNYQYSHNFANSRNESKNHYDIHGSYSISNDNKHQSQQHQQAISIDL